MSSSKPVPVVSNFNPSTRTDIVQIQYTVEIKPETRDLDLAHPRVSESGSLPTKPQHILEVELNGEDVLVEIAV